jgi:hypothetical protein
MTIPTIQPESNTTTSPPRCPPTHSPVSVLEKLIRHCWPGSIPRQAIRIRTTQVAAALTSTLSTRNRLLFHPWPVTIRPTMHFLTRVTGATKPAPRPLCPLLGLFPTNRKSPTTSKNRMPALNATRGSRSYTNYGKYLQ